MNGGGSLLRPGTPEPRYTISLGGREFPFARARLGAFLCLLHLRDLIEKAAKSQDGGALADALFHHLEAAAGVDREAFEAASWVEVALAYGSVQGANVIAEADNLALIRHAMRGKPVRWDYPLREVFVWIDMLGRAYGWRRDETLDLYPEEAVALAQEVEAHAYYERRFDHALSTVAYHAERGGRTTYTPLSEPYWMVMGAGEPKTTRIDKRTLPQGLVIYPASAPEALKH